MVYEFLAERGLFEFSEASRTIDSFFQGRAGHLQLDKPDVSLVRDLVYLNAAEAELPPLQHLPDGDVLPVQVSRQAAELAILATDCMPFGGLHPHLLRDVTLFSSDASKIYQQVKSESLEVLESNFVAVADRLQSQYRLAGDAAGSLAHPAAVQMKLIVWRAKLAVLVGRPISQGDLETLLPFA